MRWIQSFLVAMSTYSALPMPQFEWNRQNMKYAICFFPAVGILLGGALWGWYRLGLAADMGGVLFAAVSVGLPVFLTGGIHMDGFMDTVDALASRSLDRLCRTIQLADTGIAPGSGVGNHRHALDRESLGVPVIAIGVPTVVDGATLCADLLEEAGQHPDPQAISQAPGATLMVTPRDIDQRVEDMAKVIGYALSLSLQPALDLESLQALIE